MPEIEQVNESVEIPEIEPSLLAEESEEQEQEEKPKESDFIVNVKLTDDVEHKIKQIFRDELNLIHTERAELYNGKGLEQQIKDNQDLYDGEVEPPETSWNSAHYHIWLTTMMVDIGTLTATEQIAPNKPLITLEPDDVFDKNELEYDLRDREDRLDYKLRNKIKIDDIIPLINREAFIQGTCAVKVPMHNEYEYTCYKEIYEVKPEEAIEYTKNSKSVGDIKRFEDDFPNHITNDKEHKNFLKLLMEGKVTVTVEDKINTYYGVRPYIINLNKLWLRPKIKDLMRQKLIAEEIELTWSDLQKRADVGYFIPDKFDELQNKAGTDFEKKDYTLFECRLFCNIEGKLQRYMATIDKETETILRCVYYPYKHRKMDVVIFNILPKTDNVYGYGLCERSKDSNKMLDNSWNITFDSFTFANNPLIDTDDKDLQFSLQDWSPLSKIKHEKGTIVRPFDLASPKIETLAITQMGERFAEFGTGISAMQSGRESLSDPSAPMGKVAMLLDRSDRRLRSYILELKKSYCILAELVEKTELQFNSNDYDYISNGNKVSVNNMIYSKNVRYTMPGLDIDKQTDLRLITGFIQLIVAYYPEKMQNPEIRYQLLKSVIDNTGGTIERIKDIINKSPKTEQEEALKAGLKDIIQNLVDKGQPGQPTAQSQIAQQPIQAQKPNAWTGGI